MTNAPQSPYGPASSATQQLAPHTGVQPPFNASQYYPQQAPYGYTVVGPLLPLRSNGPGLASLIIGIVSVVTALIPFVGFLSYLLGTAGLILGIIGLVLADRPRRQAAWGTALSAASMLLAFIFFLVFLYMFAVLGTGEGWN